MFQGSIATCAVERDAGEGGAHFKARETGLERGCLTGFENQRTDAAANPIGMHEEGADFGGVRGWIEEGIFARDPDVAAVQRLTSAPAAAADDYPAAGFRDEIGAVGDELAINSEDFAQSGVDLLRTVVAGLQATDGGVDEVAQDWDIGVPGDADGNVFGIRGQYPI